MVYVVLEQEKMKNRLYEPRDINDVKIQLQRGPCLGVCPEYSLIIYGNGTVLYEGLANVNTSGDQRSVISQDQVRQLLAAFKTIDYFALNETEIESQIVYDAPVCTTTLLVNENTKTIRHYESAEPASLTWLEELIDATVNSNQWIQ